MFSWWAEKRHKMKSSSLCTVRYTYLVYVCVWVWNAGLLFIWACFMWCPNHVNIWATNLHMLYALKLFFRSCFFCFPKFQFKVGISLNSEPLYDSNNFKLRGTPYAWFLRIHSNWRMKLAVGCVDVNGLSPRLWNSNAVTP